MATDFPFLIGRIGLTDKWSLNLPLTCKQRMEDGQPVGYMYRDEPDSEDDSGWRFFSGQESQQYVDNPSNTQVCPVAFVAETTPDIIPYLLAKPGMQFDRSGTKFVCLNPHCTDSY